MQKSCTQFKIKVQFWVMGVIGTIIEKLTALFHAILNLSSKAESFLSRSKIDLKKKWLLPILRHRF